MRASSGLCLTTRSRSLGFTCVCARARASCVKDRASRTRGVTSRGPTRSALPPHALRCPHYALRCPPDAIPPHPPTPRRLSVRPFAQTHSALNSRKFPLHPSHEFTARISQSCSADRIATRITDSTNHRGRRRRRRRRKPTTTTTTNCCCCCCDPSNGHTTVGLSADPGADT